MQKIRIDFDNPGLPQHISAVENDSQSRFFQATLYENSKAYTAPEGATYSIMYRGFGSQNQGWYDTINDGAGKRAACAVSGNVVTCEIARQALQVPGHVSIVLCVTTGKGYMLKSWPIECDCKNDRYDSTAEIQSFFYIAQVSNADWTQAIQAWEDLKNTIDPTLSLSGKAADAAKVGEAVGQVKKNLIKKIHVYDDSFLTGEYGDANTVPPYSIVTYTYIDGVKNVPANEKGTLISLSIFQKNVATTQEYIGFNNNIWYRNYVNNNWLEWKLITSDYSTVQPFGKLFYKDAEAPYNDLNTLQLNRIYCYTNSINLINAPYKDFNGIVYSLSNFKTNVNTQISVQHAISFTNSLEFVRTCTSHSWSEWTLLNPDDAVFTVGANKQFRDPVTCFKTIQKYDFHKKVIIYPGEYDIYNLMGGHDYFSNLDTSQSTYDIQPWINNVEIIGVGNVVLKMHIPPDIPKSTTWLFSAINIYGDATIKNITIDGSNIRYCIHDESGKNYPYTKRLYENVNCTIDEHVTIGCGYSAGTKIKMINCNLRSESGGAYSYHSKGGIVFDAQNCIFSTGSNDSSAVRFSEENTKMPDRVTLSNCYLDGKNSIEIRGEWDYSPAIGYTDIKLINTKADKINNGYNSNNKPVVFYNTISGEKNTIIPVS